MKRQRKKSKEVMKVLLGIIAALVLCVVSANAQGLYTVAGFGPFTCDTSGGLENANDFDTLTMFPGQGFEMIFYYYELRRDGHPYVRFYILCDGRVVQQTLPHGDIPNQFGTIGSVPGWVADWHRIRHAYVATEFSWGLRFVLWIYKDGVLRMAIEYPYPGQEDHIEHGALVSYP